MIKNSSVVPKLVLSLYTSRAKQELFFTPVFLVSNKDVTFHVIKFNLLICYFLVNMPTLCRFIVVSAHPFSFLAIDRLQ